MVRLGSLQTVEIVKTGKIFWEMLDLGWPRPGAGARPGSETAATLTRRHGPSIPHITIQTTQIQNTGVLSHLDRAETAFTALIYTTASPR